THGEPSDRNAHPQLDPDGRVAVIHNGIVENFEALRARYGRGPFASDTDTEVLAHMLATRVEAGDDLLEALRLVVSEAEGAFSVVAMAIDQPGRLVAARVGNAGGIVVGVGEDEHLLASDLGALLPQTRRVSFLEPGELVDMTAEAVRYIDMEGAEVRKAVETLSYDPVSATKGPYKHFMLKEIHEQPESVLNAIRGRYLVHPHRVDFSQELPPERFSDTWARNLSRVVIVGMGTSMH